MNEKIRCLAVPGRSGIIHNVKLYVNSNSCYLYEEISNGDDVLRKILSLIIISRDTGLKPLVRFNNAKLTPAVKRILDETGTSYINASKSA